MQSHLPPAIIKSHLEKININYNQKNSASFSFLHIFHRTYGSQRIQVLALKLQGGRVPPQGIMESHRLANIFQ